MKKIVVLAGGRLGNPSFYRVILKDADMVICANGGVAHAMKLGIVPQLVVGDLDSLAENQKEWMDRNRVRAAVHSRDKDYTDTHLALKEAIGLSPDEVVMLGCIGDRMDHTLSNIFLLLECAKAGIKAKIMDEVNEMYVVGPERELELTGAEGQFVSLVPLTTAVSGIFTSGLKYRLRGDSLEMRESRGISNEFTEKKALVKVKSGFLLVVKISGEENGNSALS